MNGSDRHHFGVGLAYVSLASEVEASVMEIAKKRMDLPSF